MNINIDKFSDAIARELANYSENVTRAVKECSKKGAKKYAKKAKKKSPKLTGDYAKGWTSTETSKGKYHSRYKIHNKTEYPLTHLLEHGHIGRDGKRVPPKVHISPIEQEAVEEFRKSVTEAIQ